MNSFEKKLKFIISNHVYISFVQEFKNSNDLESNEKSNVKKVKVKNILDHSINNLKEWNLIWFKENTKKFISILNDTDRNGDIVLVKTKGRKEYRVSGCGNNRVFFVKNFPELVGRDWIWAEVFEIDLSKGEKSI